MPNSRKSYAFGMEMPGRTWTHSDYRYGNQSSEDDDEIFKGAQNLGLREYDERIGRMFNLDPFKSAFPGFSPYSYANNSPIAFIDQEGGFRMSAITGGTRKQRARLESVLRVISNAANSNPSLNNPFITNFMFYAGLPMNNDGLQTALRILSKGSGPIVVIDDNLPALGRYQTTYEDGSETGLSEYVRINGNLLTGSGNFPDQRYQGIFGGLASNLTAVFVLWHEGMHYASYNNCTYPSCGSEGGPQNANPNGPCDRTGWDIGDWAENCTLGFNLYNVNNWEAIWPDGKNGINQCPPDRNAPMYNVLSNENNSRAWWNLNNRHLIKGPYVTNVKFDVQKVSKAAHAVGAFFKNIGQKIGSFFNNLFFGTRSRYDLNLKK